MGGSTPGASHLTSSDLGLTGSDQGDLPPPKPLSAAKARDMAPGVNVLAGEEAPGVAQPAQVQVPVEADAKAVAALTVHELRIALRSRGLSPAGSRATLVERLLADQKLEVRELASGTLSGGWGGWAGWVGG